jgi:hypothetical protein
MTAGRLIWEGKPPGGQGSYSSSRLPDRKGKLNIMVKSVCILICQFKAWKKHGPHIDYGLPLAFLGLAAGGKQININLIQ